MEAGSFMLDENGCISKKRLATCVAGLLYEMAYIDGSFHENELATITKSLSKTYDIGETNSDELFDIMDYIRSQKESIDEFIAVLKNAYTVEQRENIYNLLLDVAIADGIIDPQEIDLARLIRSKLGLEGGL